VAGPYGSTRYVDTLFHCSSSSHRSGLVGGMVGRGNERKDVEVGDVDDLIDGDSKFGDTGDLGIRGECVL
jgi:hypothetical protein